MIMSLRIFWSCLLVALSVFQPVAFAQTADSVDQVIQEKVIVYNWPAYLPESVLDDFTKETGIKVVYSTYANNEVLHTQLKLLKGRGYDVVIPSSHLVARLRDEGLIQPINHNKLENFNKLDPNLLNKQYDPDNEFSIPYLWGSTGIGVNTKKVDIAKIQKWEDLWHKQWRNRVLLTDDMMEVFKVALKINGDSINTSDPEKIKQAYEKLRGLMPNVKLFRADEPHKALLSGEADLGVIWNGEVITAQAENPAIQYVYPKEGASFWIDSFAIPARATHVGNAYKFIDYMLRPEISARCVKELGYATPNLRAKELLDENVRNNPFIFPSAEVLENAEFQKDLGRKVMELYGLYWGKLKAGE